MVGRPYLTPALSLPSDGPEREKIKKRGDKPPLQNKNQHYGKDPDLGHYHSECV